MEIMLDAPNLGELEKKYLCDCIDSTYVSTVGPFVPDFENKFAKYVDSGYAVSTQSGTAAIHLSLHELGIAPGDEIIVPVITFIATVNPIIYMGATPVFVDIDPQTWNMDPEQVEKAITPKTKAIMPVHLYGNPCEMNALMDISKRYGIPIIEDATESLGATFNGKMTGTFGIMNSFSFNGNKIITTAGGGMLVTDNKDRADHLKFLVNQARDVSKGYFHPEVGFNYRMTNLEASLGLAQLERLPEFLKKKKDFSKIYSEVFKDNSIITMQQEYPGASSSWWLSSVIIDHPTKNISEIQEELKQKGIPTRRIFCPITDFPPYEQYQTQDYPVADRIYEKGLNLPSSTLNSEDTTEEIANALSTVVLGR